MTILVGLYNFFFISEGMERITYDEDGENGAEHGEGDEDITQDGEDVDRLRVEACGEYEGEI